jgi:amino acid adenylation domain-containing protein
VASNVTSENLGYVIYTSGSTGQPTGVALPQRALTNLIAWQLRRPDFRPAARALQFSSISFDVSFQELFSTFCTGGTLVLVPEGVRRDSRALLAYLIEHRVQRLFLPFVALRGLAEAAITAGRIPSDLREVYTAGEQLQVDGTICRFFESMPNCLLENQYGPSEAHVVTAHRLEGAPSTWPALPPIGKAIANTTLHIFDSRMQRRPVGVPGELYIGGICLARGYFGKPDITAERFIPDPFDDTGRGRLYRTGDLARRLPDGSVQFLGRADNQVKFRGFRIEPGEIGAVLSSHEGVAQSIVMVRNVSEGKPRLVAYLKLRAESNVSLAELHRFARERLPDYMVPSHFVTLDSFPLTPSGKIDRASLPEPSFDRAILGREAVPPRSLDELALARIWSNLLGIPEIGVRDDFFELGGDSLTAVEMLVAIQNQFGRELPLGALARSPNIESLAKLLRDGAAVEVYSSLVPIQPAGTRTPLFCVHGGSGNVASFPILARRLPDGQPFYGLQWDGLDGTRGSRTVEEMAAHYLAEVRSVQPHGPYLLAGECFGGLVALEMTHQLLREGERVALLAMFDSPNMNSPAYLPGERTPFLRALMQMGEGRRRRVMLLLRRSLGIRVLPADRETHGSLTMVSAAWKYHVRPAPVRTLYFSSGECRGKTLDLAGEWLDRALGWSPFFSEPFENHPVVAKHNEVLINPETARVLARVLEELGEQRTS